MIIGFTGTRDKVTRIQKERLAAFLYNMSLHRYDRLFHGGAENADEEAHNLAQQFSYSIEIFPCNGDRRHYWLDRKVKNGEATLIHATNKPLDRNRVIAERCNYLVAVPYQMDEIQRSGTWATVRYAREKRKSLTIIFPDGTIKEERRNGDRNLAGKHELRIVGD